MTEDEAKKKTCPMMTYTANEDAVVQDGRHPLLWPSLCSGSGCMAWRVSEAGKPAVTITKETGTFTPRVSIPKPDKDHDWARVKAGVDKGDRDRDAETPYRWVSWSRVEPAIPDQGFCGLAGKP